MCEGTGGFHLHDGDQTDGEAHAPSEGHNGPEDRVEELQDVVGQYLIGGRRCDVRVIIMIVVL